MILATNTRKPARLGPFRITNRGKQDKASTPVRREMLAGHSVYYLHGKMIADRIGYF